mmetsp:Transcript_96741/g.273318  ORF Transcript_96741/g.273318 Transcript_96741/m.273318 type:complete len:80 (-) Transcript_96741:253-492(-)
MGGFHIAARAMTHHKRQALNGRLPPPPMQWSNSSSSSKDREALSCEMQQTTDPNRKPRTSRKSCIKLHVEYRPPFSGQP